MGFLFAAAGFVISAVSIPMPLDRKVSVHIAIALAGGCAVLFAGPPARRREMASVS